MEAQQVFKGDKTTQHMAATFVLVGGEAYEWQGIPQKEKREFQHTSVEFIGSAYQSLRQAGIPRDRIITVVQLRDYLDTLISGEGGALTDLTGIPPKWYTEQRELKFYTLYGKLAR